nr:MAG TPA: hypothetical protein [Caudoviricetes sp.]
MRYNWEYPLVAVMLLVMIMTFWFSKVVLRI